MPHRTDDLRIREIKELAPPAHLIREFPCTEKAADTVAGARAAVHRILHGMDDRLLVVVGPCSIHDPKAAREYAGRLVVERQRHARRPRGGDARLLREAAHHRRLEGAHQRPGARRQLPDQPGAPPRARAAPRRRGAGAARRLRVPRHDHAAVRGGPRRPGAPSARAPPRARCTASSRAASPARSASRTAPTASVRIAIDAIKAAQQPHHFLSVTKAGHSAIVSTNGNEDCHVILRGGKAPNYDAASVEAACQALAKARARAAAHDRRLPRQRREEGGEPGRGRAGRRRAGGAAATPASWASWWRATSSRAGRTSSRAGRSPTARASPTPASAGRTPCRCWRRSPPPRASAASRRRAARDRTGSGSAPGCGRRSGGDAASCAGAAAASGGTINALRCRPSAGRRRGSRS